MPVLLVVGYGPGVSDAVVRRFGREGYAVALLARNADRLNDAVSDLRAAGFDASAFPCDATDIAALRRAIEQARRQCGPITTVLWTAFGHGAIRDVLEADPHDVEQVFSLGVTGLLTCVQATLADLKQAPNASVLVVNGSLGERTDTADAAASRFGADGVALENAAKAKLVGLLGQRLRDDSIFVGELTIAGTIAGTATASPTAIDPADIAAELWTMSRQRDPARIRVEEPT